MSALELKIPPPVWFVASLVIAFGLDWLTPGARLSVAGLPQIGVVLAIVSVLFALAAIRAFRRHETTIHPTHPGKTTALVMEGPFRLSRNPMYVGLVGVLLAAVCSLQNPVSLIALPCLVWAVTRFQIIPEERTLAANFSGPYTDYCRRVPRWLIV
ncbi:MAG: isoprenylcysteine carboxylmethyltransferase family protein [Pseudomonadota bacterium]